MNLHEYQAKQLLKQYGFPVPMGEVVWNLENALKVLPVLAAIVGWSKPKSMRVGAVKPAV